MLKNRSRDLKNIQREIKFLTNSDSRLKILYALFKSPQTLKEIQEITGLNSSSISINISDLESNDYVVNRNYIFYLTNTSKMILTNISYLNRAVNFLDKNADFLNMHNLSNIKFDAFKDISSLDGSELVEASPFDIFKTVRLFKDFGMGSKSIKAIFPYVHPQLDELFRDWLENDVNVKLILEEDVSAVFSKSFNDFEFEKESNSQILLKTIDRKLDFALMITDNGIIFGFYRYDGKFDKNAIFISKDEDAIIWANDVFEEYENLVSDYFYLKK